MRGSLTLFTDIFEESSTTSGTKKKGRSSELHAKRNECLIHRYYFYGNFSDMRYTAIIEALANEFFLSTATIPDIIQDNIHILKHLKDDRPNKIFFVKKYAHLNW
ncbi:hypothetical protein [Sporocytophaga myxococcoides]|uniref:hypothetical protein n=1 Tax=Sporocytophaga myxococcoides TaxID=153721 RepID=UPI0004916BCC|nr:hypothetical protein [Sporocytophaga myxococcoides]